MLAARGMPVSYLRREAEGTLLLDGLRPGEVRNFRFPRWMAFLRVFVIFTDELKAKNRKILPAVLELMTKNYEKFTKKTSFLK